MENHPTAIIAKIDLTVLVIFITSFSLRNFQGCFNIVLYKKCQCFMDIETKNTKNKRKGRKEKRENGQ